MLLYSSLVLGALWLLEEQLVSLHQLRPKLLPRLCRKRKCGTIKYSSPHGLPGFCNLKRSLTFLAWPCMLWWVCFGCFLCAWQCAVLDSSAVAVVGSSHSQHNPVWMPWPMRGLVSVDSTPADVPTAAVAAPPEDSSPAESSAVPAVLR